MAVLCLTNTITCHLNYFLKNVLIDSSLLDLPYRTLSPNDASSVIIYLFIYFDQCSSFVAVLSKNIIFFVWTETQSSALRY